MVVFARDTTNRVMLGETLTSVPSGMTTQSAYTRVFFVYVKLFSWTCLTHSGVDGSTVNAGPGALAMADASAGASSRAEGCNGGSADVAPVLGAAEAAAELGAPCVGPCGEHPASEVAASSVNKRTALAPRYDDIIIFGPSWISSET
jgi:hypothetical protein